MHLTLPLNSLLKQKLTSILQQLVTGASMPVKTLLKQSFEKKVFIWDFFLLSDGHKLIRQSLIVSVY